MWADGGLRGVNLADAGCETPLRVDVSEGHETSEIETPAGSNEPQRLTVRDADSEVTLSGVLIGEVWICSGQSNMYMPLRGYTGQPVEGTLRTILESNSDRDRTRLMTPPKKEAETPHRTFTTAPWVFPHPARPHMSIAAAYSLAPTLTVPPDVRTLCA